MGITYVMTRTYTLETEPLYEKQPLFTFIKESVFITRQYSSYFIIKLKLTDHKIEV